MHQDEVGPPAEAEQAAEEDLERPWELRLRDALVDAARRRQDRRRCRH